MDSPSPVVMIRQQVVPTIASFLVHLCQPFAYRGLQTPITPL